MIKKEQFLALDITDFSIDDYCIGTKWTIDNESQLAKLMAIIVMGQASQAAFIIDELLPATPAFTLEALKEEAIVKFTVQEDRQTPRAGYPRHQRDGLIFEIISWIAAKQVSGNRCYLKDPHTSATSQGLDGIMIELSEDGSEILTSTIFEDKCSENPRKTFRDNVIPAFLDRHKNTRSAELIAAASTLIQLSGASQVQAMAIVKKVLDNNCRQYRAGFALTSEFDDQNAQRALFKGYDKVADISQTQRIGASLIIEGELRDWFDQMATKVIEYIQELEDV